MHKNVVFFVLEQKQINCITIGLKFGLEFLCLTPPPPHSQILKPGRQGYQNSGFFPLNREEILKLAE